MNDNSTLAAAREDMVREQVAARGVSAPAVLAALRRVPRERFVAPALAERAYDDGPLPIGEGQTISQPYVVAAMAEAAAIGPTDTVLEVGAGSGYAAAVLGLLAARVVAIERHAVLAAAARERLAALGIGNVELVCGDGTRGWPAAAPFDAIVVSAGAPQVPPALLVQLAPGGRLVMPLGDRHLQHLVRLTLGPQGAVQRENLFTVAFVPLIGEP